uniref:Uncharacterized protein n=1 Tax=Oryza brachyantha TaxID=4533 RepID=J3M915_ORYBR
MVASEDIGTQLFMCLATNMSVASSIPGEHSTPGPAWLVLEFHAPALHWQIDWNK